jgi:nitric oxide reductase large subunit
MNDTATTPLPERPLYLVLLAMGPTIWAAHFFTTYAAASVWCAPATGGRKSLEGAHLLVGALTIVALVGIAVVGWSGYRRHGYGAETAPHDDDTPEDRHRFLGLATMLLAGLSAVATIYVAVSTLFFYTC